MAQLKILIINVFIIFQYCSCNNEDLIVEIDKKLSIQFPLSNIDYKELIDTLDSDYTNGDIRVLKLKSKKNEIIIKHQYLDNTRCANDSLGYVRLIYDIKGGTIFKYNEYGDIEKMEIKKVKGIFVLIISYKKTNYFINLCSKGVYLTINLNNFSKQEFNEILNGLEFK